MSRAAGRLITGTRGDVLDITHDLLVVHAAWEHVGDYFSGTELIRVYKCLGTLNATGRDFFVAFRDAASGLLVAQIMDDFDPLTQTAYNVPPTSGSVGVEPDASSGRNFDITSTSIWGSYSGRQLGLTDGTSFNYYVDVTDDRIVLSVDMNMMYVGAFDSLSLSPNEFPVVIVRTVGSNGALFLRHPGREGAPSSSGHFRSNGLSSGSVPAVEPWHKYPNNIDPFIGAVGIGVRVPLSASSLGTWRGWLRDVYSVAATGPIGNWIMGDTFTDEDTDESYAIVGWSGSSGTPQLYIVPDS